MVRAVGRKVEERRVVPKEDDADADRTAGLTQVGPAAFFGGGQVTAWTAPPIPP
jgi:hypothetical protein